MLALFILKKEGGGETDLFELIWVSVEQFELRHCGRSSVWRLVIDPRRLFREMALTRHHMTNTTKSIPTSRKNSTIFFFAFILMENNQQIVSGTEL